VRACVRVRVCLLAMWTEIERERDYIGPRADEPAAGAAWLGAGALVLDAAAAASC
jgi:hypothetical protein